MKRLPRSLLLLLACALAPALRSADTISLAGEWRFALDRSASQTQAGGGRRGPAPAPLPAGDGVTQEWFKRDLPDRIQLPGILQSQGYGDDISATTPWLGALGQLQWASSPLAARYTQPGNVKVGFTSQPVKHYLGVAWYQHDIDVPAGWQGQHVTLFLERPRWETTVWVDDQKYDSANSLVAPHVHDLGMLKPGRHRLSIRIDNRMIMNYRTDGHSVSDSEGSTWNGIAGRIELQATSSVWIDDAQVFPNQAKRTAVVRVRIGNATGQAGSGSIAVGDTTAAARWDASGGTAELEVKYPVGTPAWDEFHPNLQHLTVNLSGGAAADQRELTFGFRQITWRDKDLLLNGHVMNFRGTHSGGDFPLTGYPATDVLAWKKIFQECKDYGLNGMRFHSWCPPEAAFAAADELGFYLAPECGFWDSFSSGSPMAQRLDDETAALLKAFGNHPSFLLLSPSNETGGDYPPTWARLNFERDPRRLYCGGTGNDTAAQVEDGPQYAVMPHTNSLQGGPLRTSNNQTAVWFGGDYRASLVNVHIPILAHEVGQFCAYPDFDVIKEFTGYLRPGNFEIFRDSAAEHGVLDRNHEFAWASGKFQVAAYKAEIETMLRTPGYSGYELLDLHDYLGQGTAVVGVVDSFWKPKSYITAAEYRRFSGPTVPLARLASRVFTTADDFNIPVEVAHYGAVPLTQVTPTWRILEVPSGRIAAQGTFPTLDVPLGKNLALGNVVTQLAALAAPREYRLVVGLPGADAENDWTFWLYPAGPAPAAPADVLVTTSWPDAAARLATGGKVLFTPAPGSLDTNTHPPLNNVPVFWNRMMSPRVEAMVGLWCDVTHPALAGFPTEAFCDWEWADLVRNVNAINLERAPASLRPVVSAIDDWNRNFKLGVIFEATVGSGRLLVSAIPLEGNRSSPVAAAQLRRSLLDYMAGNQFQPKAELTEADARRIWTDASAPALGGGRGFRRGPTPPPAPVTPPEVDEGNTPVPNVPRPAP